jgi:hypothetical protein
MRRKLVTQAAAERQIGPDTPVVLNENSIIELVQRRQRISSGKGELAWTATHRADLVHGQTLLNPELGHTVPAETVERKGPGIVLHGLIGERHSPQ